MLRKIKKSYIFENLIATLSLGGPRRFRLRPRDGSGDAYAEVEMTPGSVVMMAGATQDHYEHELPLRDGDESRVPLSPLLLLLHKDVLNAGARAQTVLGESIGPVINWDHAAARLRNAVEGVSTDGDALMAGVSWEPHLAHEQQPAAWWRLARAACPGTGAGPPGSPSPP